MAFFQNGQPVTNTTGDIVSKINKESIKSLADGEVADITSGDEILILDAESDETKRVTIGELAASGELGGSGSVASLNDVGDVDAAAPVDGAMLAYNQTSGNWEAAQPNPALPVFPYTFVAAPDQSSGFVPANSGEIYYSANLGLIGLTGFVISPIDKNGVNRLSTYNVLFGGFFNTLAKVFYDGGSCSLRGFFNDIGFIVSGGGGATSNGVIGIIGNRVSGTLPSVGSEVSFTFDSLGASPPLNDLTDVNAPSPNANQVLTYNGSEWVAQDAQGGTSVPGGLQYTYSTNTSPSGTTSGQIRLNGAQTTFGINITDRNSVNQSAFFASLATGLEYVVYVAHSTGAGYFQGNYTDNTADSYRFTSGSFTGVLPAADDNVEVTITPAGGGASATVASLNNVGDVSVPTPSANQVLVWDGSQWVADSITSISANGNGAFLTADWAEIGAAFVSPRTFIDSSTSFSFSVIDQSFTDRTTEFSSLAIGETVNITFSNGTAFTGEYDGIKNGPGGDYAEFNNGVLTGSIPPSLTYTVTFTTQAGNVLVGNQTIDGSLEVKGNLNVTNGGIITGDGSGITNVSDIRWKTGVSTIGIGMSFIEQLNPIKFQYQKPVAGIDTTNTDEMTKWDYSQGWELRDESWRYGFSAQEVASIETSMGSQCGIACTENPEQYALRTEGLMPIMVNALKELRQELNAVRAENTELRGRIETLEGN